MCMWQSAANLMEFVALSVTLACFYVARGADGDMETTEHALALAEQHRVVRCVADDKAADVPFRHVLRDPFLDVVLPVRR